MKTVRAILQAKGHDVWAIGPDASVYEALHRQGDHPQGHLRPGFGHQTVARLCHGRRLSIMIALLRGT